MAADNPSPPLSRAAVLGLAAGVTVAGAVLIVLALRTLSRDVDCSGPDANQCFFELGLSTDFARWQLWIGIALMLVSAGALLFLRSSERKAASPPPSV